MITHRAISKELVRFTAALLAGERRQRGTPRGSRALTCFWRAVPGLRWFRGRVTAGALAREHGISRAAACRYVDEAIAVLAGHAAELHQALERGKCEGLTHVILDGNHPRRPVQEPGVSVEGQVIGLWYVGKAHTHGGGIQAVLRPRSPVVGCR